MYIYILRAEVSTKRVPKLQCGKQIFFVILRIRNRLSVCEMQLFQVMEMVVWNKHLIGNSSSLTDTDFDIDAIKYGMPENTHLYP